MNVDSLTLYAYADKSQSRERELWKRFLKLLLPVLLEADADEVAEVFDEAVVDSVDAIMEPLSGKTASLQTAGELVRVISGTLALALGLPAEFGLSAFLESNPPTRIHAARASAVRVTDQELITRWLGRFSRIQSDDDFLEMAADWKDRLRSLLRGEKLLAAEEGAQDAQDPSLESTTESGTESTPTRGTPVPEEPDVPRRKKRSA
jgi:hypothetical protein